MKGKYPRDTRALNLLVLGHTWVGTVGTHPPDSPTESYPTKLTIALVMYTITCSMKYKSKDHTQLANTP